MIVPADDTALAVASSPAHSTSFWAHDIINNPDGKKKLCRCSRGLWVCLPSGCAILCMAVGATMMGMEILNPNTVVLRSTLVTSMRIRGRNLQFQHPCQFPSIPCSTNLAWMQWHESADYWILRDYALSHHLVLIPKMDTTTINKDSFFLNDVKWKLKDRHSANQRRSETAQCPWTSHFPLLASKYFKIKTNPPQKKRMQIRPCQRTEHFGFACNQKLQFKVDPTESKCVRAATHLMRSNALRFSFKVHWSSAPEA